MYADSVVMRRHGWAQRFLDWSQRSGRRVTRWHQRLRVHDNDRALLEDISLLWPGERWAPPCLLDKDILRMNEYISGFQRRNVATLGPHSIMVLLRMTMMITCKIMGKKTKFVSLLIKEKMTYLDGIFWKSRYRLLPKGQH